MDNIEKWIKFYNSPNIEIKKRALAQIVKVDDSRAVPILIDALEKLALQGHGADIVKATHLLNNLLTHLRNRFDSHLGQQCIVWQA